MPGMATEHSEREPELREERAAGAADLAAADWTTADEIRRRSFATVSRGFDPEEVRAYLSKLADWFSSLNSQLSQLRKAQVEVVPMHRDDGSGNAAELASRMAELLREAQAHAESVRQEVELEAHRIVADAKEQADRIGAENGELVYRMRAEAEKRLADVNAARDALAGELQVIGRRVAEIVERLESSGSGPVVAVREPSPDGAGEPVPEEIPPPPPSSLHVREPSKTAPA